MLASALCLYMVSSSVIDFYNYDIITSIKVVHKSELYFPAVTICPQYLNNTKNLHFLNFEFDKNNLKDSNYVENLILSGRNIYLDNCLSFNIKKLISKQKIKKSKISGYEGGLKIDLFLDPVEKETAFWVFVHENTIKPIYYEVNFTPNLNKMNAVTIEKTVQNSLGTPYSDCISIKEIDSFDSDLVREALKTGYPYRQKDCYELCYHKYCSNCNDSEFFDLNAVCSKHCPLECETTLFKTYLSTENHSKFLYANNKDKYKESIVKQFNLTNLTDDEFLKGLTTIFVYFQELKYTEIVQIPKTTTVDLWSSIGGTLGLFLGVSVISFFELMDILLEFYFYLKVKYF